MVRLFSFIRRRIAGFLVVFGFILLIPGILMFVISDAFYGNPIAEPGVQIATTVGSNNSIGLTGLMKVDNNYDIRIVIAVSATPANPPDSSVTVRMTVVKTGSDIATLPASHDFQRTNFNSTTITQTYEFENDFVSVADATFSFELITSENLTNIYITVELYENPNRTLADISATIGLIFLIPGFIVIMIAVCIGGRRRRSGGARKSKN